jgi:DNA processing protein
MDTSVSTNTQAILLLTAPLITGRKETESQSLLSAAEYRRIAQRLRQLGQSPSDLLQNNSIQLVRELTDIVAGDRLNRLLERGFLISQAVERWQSRAIWVLSRADSDYPKRLKNRLKEDSPPVIYGCGPSKLLDRGGLAVVGSRHVDDSLITYAKTVGQTCAQAKACVISGGAQGIDRAAMRGSLESSGYAIGVLPDSLERAALNRENRDLLLNDQLALVSPYDPSAGFNVGHAMQRNKLIYALADAALVVSADYQKGGTWAGAAEQLEKLNFVPVYVRSNGETGQGLQALAQMGAILWPNPQGADELLAVLNQSARNLSNGQHRLAFESNSAEVPLSASELESVSSAKKERASILAEQSDGGHLISPEEVEPPSVSNSSVLLLEKDPAAELFGVVKDVLVRLLKRPMSESEVAKNLQVSNAQTKSWLQRLIDDGLVEKKTKPTRYVLRQERLL